MLREWVESWRTLCPVPLRRLGHAYAAAALTARARRCREAWAPHQDRTRDAIRGAIAQCRNRHTAVILGSGPLLDVPLDDLAARFDRVLLVDAAHPPIARRAARRFPNVGLISLDLTGTAEILADPAASAPPVPGCRAFLDDPTIDLVVSVNLLSQLPLMPLACAARRWPDMDLAALGRAIVTAHLAHLDILPGVKLLVTDLDRTTLGPSGDILAIDDPLFGIRLPPGPEWTWLLAPPGELSGGRTLRSRVRAVQLHADSPMAHFSRGDTAPG